MGPLAIEVNAHGTPFDNTGVCPCLMLAYICFLRYLRIVQSNSNANGMMNRLYLSYWDYLHDFWSSYKSPNRDVGLAFRIAYWKCEFYFYLKLTTNNFVLPKPSI